MPEVERTTQHGGPNPGMPPPGLAGRVFFETEDPLAWAFPAGRIAGVRLRVHLIFPLWAAAEIVARIPEGAAAVANVTMLVGWLLVVTLVHELGRAVWARWFGADRDQVILWPLGGLSVNLNERAAISVLAEAGGLVISAVLTPLFAFAALALGVTWRQLFFNPLDPFAVAHTITDPAMLAVWWLYYANLVVVGLNLLLPMFPFDVGRIVLAAYKRTRPQIEAAQAALRIGLTSAISLFVLAAAASQTRLVAVAIFGGLAVWIVYRRSRFTATAGIPAPARTWDPDAPRKGDQHSALDTAQERPSMLDLGGELIRQAAGAAPDEHQVLVDRVLEKISREGMESLSDSERRILERETRRQRGG